MIRKITIKQLSYPRMLKEIYVPPPVIYIRGNQEILNKPAVAVVGTRKATSYGIKATKEIVNELVKANFIIVSGLALGIDTIVHQTALKNGRTIAVLGSSVDDKNIYPRENVKLANQIIKNDGVVISEYEPPFEATRYSFPQRNRIISGLSKAVVVIEAPRKSGALITARLALEQNRDVFALPGSIYSENSFGTNSLIKQGAHPITSIEEVIEILGCQDRLEI